MNLNFEDDRPKTNWAGGSVQPEVQFLSKSIEELGKFLLEHLIGALHPITIQPSPHLAAGHNKYIYAYLPKEGTRFPVAIIKGLPVNLESELVSSFYTPALEQVKTYIEQQTWYDADRYPITLTLGHLG